MFFIRGLCFRENHVKLSHESQSKILMDQGKHPLLTHYLAINFIGDLSKKGLNRRPVNASACGLFIGKVHDLELGQ